MRTPPTWVLKLDVPKPVAFPFENVFGQVEQITSDSLKGISHLRGEVVGALSHSSSEAAISAIERYLPSLQGLISAVNSLPPESVSGLKISWTTPLYAKYQNSPFTYNSLKFEWHMILYTYGILHRNAALELNLTITDSDAEEKLKQCANLLCKAAGIFECLRSEVVNWLVKPDPVFTELKDDTLVALINLSLAEAQIFTVKKAVMKSTSGPVVSKLCMDVVQKCDSSLSLLKPFSSAYEPGILLVTTYVSVIMDVFKAMALKSEALEFLKNKNFGSALGYLKVAITNMPEDKSRTIKPLEWLYKEVNLQREDLQRIFDVNNTDNNNIYYEKILDAKAINYPEGRSLMKAINYVTPPAVVVPIVLKQGTSCIIQ